jgi:hypothetical protein
MYLINADKIGTQLFQSTFNDLCIGLRYQFSVFIANIFKKHDNSSKPNVLFQVRNGMFPNDLLAESSTGDIPEYDTMTWSKHGLSFMPSNNSVIVLMISNSAAGRGNDLVIDDIELRVCSTIHSGICSPG